MGPTNNHPFIRIGHVLTAINEGGLERFVLTLAQNLPRDRFGLHVYALLRENPWVGEFESLGVPVRVFDACNRSFLRGLPRNASTLAKLARALARDRIDIVHTPDFYPGVLGRLASLAARVPARVHTLHSVYDWYPSFVFPIQRLLGRRTDAFTGVSQAALDFSQHRERHPPAKLQLIPNGADALRFRPDATRRARFRHENGWSDSDIVVGSVGVRTPRKGHPLLAEAIVPLMRQDPRLRLAILGASGREVDTRAQVRSILGDDLSSRAHFLEPRPDPETAFSSFDVHCMPSEVEGLSFASIEGLLSGCISVFSDLPAFREVSADGRFALLFQPGAAEDLRRNLEDSITLAEGGLDWRHRAREYARDRFGQDRMVAEYAALYQRLACRKGSHAG